MALATHADRTIIVEIGALRAIISPAATSSDSIPMRWPFTRLPGA
jgi:hypothetical protein